MYAKEVHKDVYSIRPIIVGFMLNRSNLLTLPPTDSKVDSDFCNYGLDFNHHERLIFTI